MAEKLGGSTKLVVLADLNVDPPETDDDDSSLLPPPPTEVSRFFSSHFIYLFKYFFSSTF